MARACAYALPTDETFRHMIPNGGWHGAFVLRDAFLEILKRNGVLDKVVYRFAAFMQYFENGARATRNACSVTIAFTVIEQYIGQFQT
jgi:hypothetical protein